MAYDFNGNITSLWRKGMTQNNTFDYIDKLGYTYATNSNKINSVSDAVIGNVDTGDFRDGNTSGNDYDYWADGSLKKDLNKGISLIEYNHLKLPKKVTYSNGNTLENQYDANGKKLKSISSEGITYDFLGNTIYKNDVLYQIGIDEGRIVNEQYEFDIKDHLGNLRVSFRDSLGIAKISTKLDYDPWGLTLKSLTYTNPTLNKNNFQFGSKEKIENFGLNWIDFGARIYMPDVPHFTTIDPLATERDWLTPYNFVLNNPILNIDINGDSVNLSNEFQNNKYAMTAFGTFSQTNAGRGFLKDFGIGGKFEAVNIVFGLSNSFGSGTTQTFAEDKEGNESQIVAKEDQSKGQNQLTSLPKNSFLKFYVNLRWGGIEVDSEKENPLSFYNGMKKIVRGETLLHETQHVRIDTYDLLNGRKGKSNYEHHAIMKATDGIYFQERVGYYNQFISKFIKQEGSYDKANKTIRIMANDFNY